MTGKRPLPHDGVYTRLKPSSIHGVGVFAICDIPKGTYIFEPDNDDTAFVPADGIRSLSPEVRRLYEDFCVLEDGVYECPSSLNKLTPAWFLNHSKSPNVSADSSLKFFAIRDIEAGEELTADYGTYSENESDIKLD
ncbi:MAG: SET domain-containing protein [Terracidiphilus sp.]|jgi:SET domain-containing protein